MTDHKADISAEAQALFEEMRRVGLTVPDIDHRSCIVYQDSLLIHDFTIDTVITRALVLDPLPGIGV